MKRLSIILIIFSISIQTYSRNAKEAFLSMPMDMFADISIENRMDLIDVYEAKNKASVLNKFQEDISIENLTEDFISLKMGNSTIQIVVLPMVNESQLYCLIYTVCAPLCDSFVDFYSLSWNKLKQDTFLSPVPQSWFIDNLEEFPELTISLMQFSFDPEKHILQQKDNSVGTLSLENQEKIKPYIKQETKSYQWNGIRFN